MYESLAILGCFIFIYSLVCRRLEQTPVNGAVVFMLFGLMVGPVGLNWLKVDVHADALSLLAELTLAFLLFTDAANADLRILEKNYQLPQRLLLIGLPLTILLGFGVGVLLFDSFQLIEVAILATILAPTDAALGKAVVTNKSVPGRIRESLNVESGLNDGLCVPVLFILLAVEVGFQSDGKTPAMAVTKMVESIGIGMLVGFGLTFCAYWMIKICALKGWVSETWRQLPVLALALMCLSVAEMLGGSGFIACFCGGLLFDRVETGHKKKLLLAAEGTGDTLALITWILFGALIVGNVIGTFTWRMIVYGLLSLSLIRMLPVFICLSGAGLRAADKLFMGWFGPRGLASIVFAVIVFNHKIPHTHDVSMTVICTILMSILAHGLSANPCVRRVFKQYEAKGQPDESTGSSCLR